MDAFQPVYRAAFVSFILVASLKKRQAWYFIILSIIKLMLEYLLSLLPILLSSENHAGPKLEVLIRQHTSTQQSRWFFAILFSSLHACSTHRSYNVLSVFSLVICTTARISELVHNKRLTDHRSSVFGVAKERHITNIRS